MKNAYKGWFLKTLFIALTATFVASPVQAIPPDPDNAALLYYQGFLTLAQLSDEARDRIGDVARGETAPDDQVREDIKKCIGAIEFAEAAAEVPTCHWGVRYSQGFEALLPQMAQMRFLAFVLIADARIHAADGNHRAALERCLMTGTFARHIGDDTLVAYLVSIGVRGLEYKCMRDIIGRAADNVELLQWFKTELAASGGIIVSPVRPVKVEIQIALDLLQMENVEEYARIITSSGVDITQEILEKANEETVKRARQIYSDYATSALTILGSPTLSYDQAHKQLKELMDRFDLNDPASATARGLAPAVDKILSQKTTIETRANAIWVAIELLLNRAKTGRLPDALPAGMPKDAFSGDDFEYVKTREGFVLRCPGKDSDVYAYEFKIEK